VASSREATPGPRRSFGQDPKATAMPIWDGNNDAVARVFSKVCFWWHFAKILHGQGELYVRRESDTSVVDRRANENAKNQL
jgi:hypothetical protein